MSAESVTPGQRHPSNRGNHPVMPDCENRTGVFEALLETVPTDAGRRYWLERWTLATRVENARRDYDREWDRSLASINWGR